MLGIISINFTFFFTILYNIYQKFDYIYICGRNKCYTYLKINERLKKKKNFKFSSKRNRALKLYIYI